MYYAKRLDSSYFDSLPDSDYHEDEYSIDRDAQTWYAIQDNEEYTGTWKYTDEHKDEAELFFDDRKFPDNEEKLEDEIYYLIFDK